jgi:predicted HicB family RNase H-like nuclease
MTSYKGFIPRFYIDLEKRIIRGNVLNTRDTITFYGNTVAQAHKAFQASVDDYLEFCKEIGVEPEKPFSGRLLLRINPKMHRRLSFRAQQQGQSINALVGIVLESALKKKGLKMKTSSVVGSHIPPADGTSKSSKPKTKLRAGSK